MLASAESAAVVDHGCTHHSQTAHTQLVEVAAEDNVCDAAMPWILEALTPKSQLGVASEPHVDCAALFVASRQPHHTILMQPFGVVRRSQERR